MITPQPVALDLTEASPITDQVFVGDTSEKDEVPDDPSEEYPGQSAMVMYEKCLLEELQGISLHKAKLSIFCFLKTTMQFLTRPPIRPTRCAVHCPVCQPINAWKILV